MQFRTLRRIWLAVLIAALSGMLVVPTAFAAGPDHFGPYSWDDTMYFSDFCGEAGRSMEVELHTQGWQAFTVWADENGDVQKVIDRERAPFDTFTNLATGRQFVVRGEFQEIIERIPGTDEFTKSISGFRYLVNQPGEGVVIQEVGRIVYADLEQTLAVWEAGKHELVYDQDFVAFCDLLD